MENTIKLSVVTPDGIIFEGDVKSAVLPGKDGEFGVMPSHSSLVSSLDVGVIEITNKDGSTDAIAINWGHVKVDETHIDVLIDNAISLDPKNPSKINQNINNAKELVKSVHATDVSLSVVEAKISSFA
jgi:F-type H+-transporting ATPase subunit epsilon